MEKLNKLISNNSAVEKCFVFLVILYTLFQLIDLKAEYPFFLHQRVEQWYIHHDEKLIVPDARYFFLQNNNDIDLLDYKTHPVSAAFGIGGPILSTIGFELFGMNNFGLRFFFVIISGITILLCILSILRLSPGLIGISFSIFYLINYNNFIITRHAIIENILTLFLTFILWAYISHRDYFLSKIKWFVFFTPLCLLFKPNFILYVYLLVFLILIFEERNFFVFFKLFPYCIAGLIVFEGLQFFILCNLGIFRWRYYNLLAAWTSHSGGDMHLLQHFKAPGVNIFPRFFVMLVEWYLIPLRFINKTFYFFQIDKLYYFISIAILLLTCLIIYVIWFRLYRKTPKIIWIILIYIFIYLVISANFYFYLKRAISLFPLTVILFSYIVYQLTSWLLNNFLIKDSLIYLFLFIIFSLYIFTDLWLCGYAMGFRTDGIERNCNILSQDLPSNATIYMHCYGYRFFWELTGFRLMSCDDQFMNNQMIFDWALESEARYIVFSRRGGNISLESSIDLIYINKYNTSESESDTEDCYTLYEIRYK